ncbi:MAG: methylenetetrahydrofolate reductase [NAD(P)H] [Hyphomicrobiales bacterium]|nr:methylenetetrahydrofolate reductase [NAD(P)H] [Hyphomicrobiales bacterium]
MTGIAGQTGRATGSGDRDIKISFEFFPPKTAKMENNLWSAIEKLAPLQPSFVSVTYGAGGSTRERTHATVARIVNETDLLPAAHLTCVAASRDEVNTVIRSYRDAGVRHIVALRGDAQEGAGTPYVPHPDGYRNACDLTAGIREIGDFEISVAAYPEKHPDSVSVEADIDNLKAKIDTGATRAITQFFFDNDHYFRFVDRVRAAGVSAPIVPGIIPIHSFPQVARFAKQCGATIPAAIAERFDGLENDTETSHLLAAVVAAEQVMGLAEQGIDDFHFYTLNRANLVFAMCRCLGISPYAEDREPQAA